MVPVSWSSVWQASKHGSGPEQDDDRALLKHAESREVPQELECTMQAASWNANASASSQVGAPTRLDSRRDGKFQHNRVRNGGRGMVLTIEALRSLVAHGWIIELQNTTPAGIQYESPDGERVWFGGWTHIPSEVEQADGLATSLLKQRFG